MPQESLDLDSCKWFLQAILQKFYADFVVEQGGNFANEQYDLLRWAFTPAIERLNYIHKARSNRDQALNEIYLERSLGPAKKGSF